MAPVIYLPQVIPYGMGGLIPPMSDGFHTFSDGICGMVDGIHIFSRWNPYFSIWNPGGISSWNHNFTLIIFHIMESQFQTYSIKFKIK